MTPSPRSQPQSGTRLEAGRALDALIAERFFGDEDTSRWAEWPPHFSVDIACAWVLVEKLTATAEGGPGVEVMVRWWVYSRRWCAQIHDLSGKMRFANEKADSAAHAICLAALAAFANADPRSRPDDGGARDG